MAQFQFNAHAVEPADGGGSQLPIGDLPVIITESTVKENKKKDGGFIELGLLVIDGQHKGARGAFRLNVYNPNEQTVLIANRQLSAICHCINVFNITDTSQLHNLPFRVIVEPQADPKYTEVKSIRDINGNPASRAGAGPQQPLVQTPQVTQQSAQPVVQSWQASPQQPQLAQPTQAVQQPQQPAWQANAQQPPVQVQQPVQPAWQTQQPQQSIQPQQPQQPAGGVPAWAQR